MANNRQGIEKMSLKPCIECGKECEVFPIQLGDFFTLTYLRICSDECMFLTAYEFLREIGEHKSFRAFLYKNEYEDDKKERDEFVDAVTKDSIENMRKHFEANPNILSHPVPKSVIEMFSKSERIPFSSGQTMRFMRPTKQQRIEWANERLKRLKEDLKEAINDLERLENE